ncbi:MAG: 50S ribosomal protein L25 [Bacteroidales bacterium]|jgi:large subunit ribosomal protein L25|nr:50S ribosomal protein L25 [Bacteroidales bacterium]
MDSITLQGVLRKKGTKHDLNALRKSGMVPCVIYGNKTENINFALSERDLTAILNTPNSYIIDIEIEGKKHMCILYDKQFHPVSDKPLHIDFLAVSTDKPVVMEIPLQITGAAAGVKDGGKLFVDARKVKVSALIDSLPDYLTVDVTPLKIGDTFCAGDIVLDGVTVLVPKKTVICSIKMTRAVATDTAAQAAGETAGEEGAAPAEGAAAEAGSDADKKSSK